MDKSIVMDQYKRGDFRWKNGAEDTEVEFVENEQGRFFIDFISDEDVQKPIFE